MKIQFIITSAIILGYFNNAYCDYWADSYWYNNIKNSWAYMEQDGEYAVTASNDQNSIIGNTDYYYSKIDHNGYILESKIIGTDNDDYLSVQQLSNDNYLVSGSIKKRGTFNYRTIWAEFDPFWNPIYQKIIRANNDIIGRAIKTNDGGLLITGTTNSFGDNCSDEDILIIKTNQNGEIIWSRSIDYSSTDRIGNIIEYDDGFIVSFTIIKKDINPQPNLGTSTTDLIVLKISQSGGLLWKKELTCNDLLFQGINLFAGCMIKASNGDIIFYYGTAYEIDYNYNNVTALIIRLNSAGEVLWSKTYKGDGNTSINLIREANNNLFFSGVIRCSSSDLI